MELTNNETNVLELRHHYPKKQAKFKGWSILAVAQEANRIPREVFSTQHQLIETSCKCNGEVREVNLSDVQKLEFFICAMALPE